MHRVGRRVTRAGGVGAAASLIGGAGSTLLLALAAGPAGATPATWTVDNTGDGAANAANCTTPVVGQCTLRDALAAASSGDTITFEPSLFTGGPVTITSTNGMFLDPGADIIGPGSELLTLHGDGIEGVIEVNTAVSGNTLSGLTVTGGYGSIGSGGGVASIAPYMLTLRDAVITGNFSANGGGVSAFELTMIDSTVSNNVGAYLAGGVYVSGNAHIENSTISGNSVTGLAGGSAAGGIVVAANTAQFDILNSTISDNTVGGRGASGGGVFIYGSDVTATIANSTITGNSAERGGGIVVAPGNALQIGMSTISGNTATGTDEFYSGGGIFVVAGGGAGPGALPSNRASLSNPRRPSGSPPTSALSMIGTVLAGNTSGVGGAADLSVGGGNPGTGTVLAISSMLGTASSNVTVNGTSLLRGADPKLGALADNGGPTKTMLPQSGSPLIDSGPATIPEFPGSAFDQRGPGFLRIFGTSSDIGAVEIQAPPAPPEPPAEPKFTG